MTRVRLAVATIRDVARAAGVSIATVSAILNGTARVSEKLTKRVWQAIEATQYSPDGVARSLRLGRTSSIGLVVGDISNPFFTSLAKAVESRASEAGYLVIVANTDEQPDRELKPSRQFLMTRRLWLSKSRTRSLRSGPKAGPCPCLRPSF